MAEATGISWTDSTWSPWEGCTKVSPGCDNCYAARMNGWLRKGDNWGPGAPRREYSAKHWQKPLDWNAAARKAGKRLRVFPSVCDPFDNEVDVELRAKFFSLILKTPHIDWLLLTKRIGNVERMLQEVRHGSDEDLSLLDMMPLPNLWLGATVVNQEEADRDIPKLLAVPAAVRFLSIEPMLGPVDLRVKCPPEFQPHLRCDRINWVIAGGEAGPKARPMHPDWARSLRDQCAAAGVAFHHKQNGEFASVSEVAGPGAHWRFPDGATVRRVGKAAAGRLLDGVEHAAFPPAHADQEAPC